MSSSSPTPARASPRPSSSPGTSRVGDTVKVNDIVVEVETAKSLVELPVPFAGTVSAIHVAEGDTVEVGTPIITIDDGQGGGPDAAAPAPAAAAAPAATSATPAAAAEEEIGEGLIGGTTSTGRTAVLVGYGVKQTEAKRRPRKGRPRHGRGTERRQGSGSPDRGPERRRRSPARALSPSRRSASWPRTWASTSAPSPRAVTVAS